MNVRITNETLTVVNTQTLGINFFTTASVLVIFFVLNQHVGHANV